MRSLRDIIKNADTVWIGGHEHPDGDCIGSCLGLALGLKKLNPSLSVTVCLEDFPAAYARFSALSPVVFSADGAAGPDVFFALDCADKDRIAVCGRIFDAAAHTVVIDHHISNTGYGRERHIVPSASSTSELVYDLLRKDNIPMDKDIAACLYLGIIQDTGVFQYPSTSPHTMTAAAKLMETGIDFSSIVEETFFQKTHVQNRLLGKALLESRLSLDGLLVFSVLTARDFEALGAAPADAEGIVSLLRNTAGVDTAAFLYETRPAAFKVSLRSKQTVDVAKVAAAFGGGGHVRAAACEVCNKRPEAILAVLEREIAGQLSAGSQA